MNIYSRTRSGLMFLCAIIGLGGLFSSHANAQKVYMSKAKTANGNMSAISGIEINGSKYDVAFYFTKTFHDIYGKPTTRGLHADGTDIIEKYFDRKPTFWRDKSGAIAAANAIVKLIGPKDTIAYDYYGRQLKYAIPYDIDVTTDPHYAQHYRDGGVGIIRYVEIAFEPEDKGTAADGSKEHKGEWLINHGEWDAMPFITNNTNKKTKDDTNTHGYHYGQVGYAVFAKWDDE